MNSQIEALECTFPHKELLQSIYEYFIGMIEDNIDGEFTPHRDIGGEVWMLFDIGKSACNRAIQELVQMGLLHRNRSRNATYMLPNKFKMGQQIDATEEAKNLSKLYVEKYNNLWQLILDCNRDIRKEQNCHWERIRMCHPELADYEFSYNFQTNVITILSKKEE